MFIQRKEDWLDSYDYDIFHDSSAFCFLFNGMLLEKAFIFISFIHTFIYARFTLNKKCTS